MPNPLAFAPRALLGVLVAPTLAAAPPEQHVVIPSGNAVASSFKTSREQLLVWKGTLSSSEVTQSLAAGKPLVTQGLAGYTPTPPWITWAVVAVAIVAAILVFFDLSDFLRNAGKQKRGTEDADLVSKEEGMVQDKSTAAPASEPTINPRRWYILTMAAISVFGTDSYINIPTSFFAGEVGQRNGTGELNSLYFASFSIGGVIATAFGVALLDRYPANRLNRIALLISCLFAVVQGLCHLAKDSASFVAPLVVLRIIEGFPGIITEVCAQTMVMRAFPSKELPAALGAFMGLRQVGIMISFPLGGALYGAGGFGLPYFFGGCVLLIVYVAVYFTLAREPSMDKTPENRSVLFLLKHWRFTAVALKYGWNFVVIQVLFSNMQIWLGAKPYNKTPVEVSVVSICGIVAFVFAIGIYQAISAKLTFYWTGFACSLISLFGCLLVGYRPPLDPNFPATYGAAIGIYIMAVCGSAMIAANQPMATYLLTNYYGIPRENVDAPIGVTFVLMSLIGAFLGPIAFGPLVDAYGYAVTITTVSCIDIFVSLIGFVGMWPASHLTEFPDPLKDKDEDADKDMKA